LSKTNFEILANDERLQDILLHAKNIRYANTPNGYKDETAVHDNLNISSETLFVLFQKNVICGKLGDDNLILSTKTLTHVRSRKITEKGRSSKTEKQP